MIAREEEEEEKEESARNLQLAIKIALPSPPSTPSQSTSPGRTSDSSYSSSYSPPHTRYYADELLGRELINDSATSSRTTPSDGSLHRSRTYPGSPGQKRVRFPSGKILAQVRVYEIEPEHRTTLADEFLSWSFEDKVAILGDVSSLH